MTMGFCHADQVQNISTAGQVLGRLISVNRTFATRSLQLNYSLPLRIDISYIYVLCATICLFILTLHLKYVNKEWREGGEMLSEVIQQFREEKKRGEERKRWGNASAGPGKRSAMCPC